MPPMNPCGLHIQAQAPNVDRSKLIAHLRAANYGTVTILDDYKLAMELTDILPGAVIVHRAFEEPEPGPPRGASADVIKKHAVDYFQSKKAKEWGANDPRAKKVILNVNCECDWSRERCDWYAYMIEEAARFDIGLVVGNWAAGVIKSGMGSDPNAWLTDAELLLRTIAKYRDRNKYFIGLHEYSTFYVWAVMNGLAPERKDGWKFENAPKQIDWNQPQWHIGRCIGLVRACEKFGIAKAPILITECSLDDMQDISKRMPVKLAPGYSAPRGWRSLVPQWAEWYPGRDPGEIYADMNIWVWEKVYKPLGCVVGSHAYCYGDASGDKHLWKSFLVEDSPGYLQRMEKYARELAAQAAPLPKPAAAGSGESVTLTGGGASNMRSGPGTDYPVIDSLPESTTITWYPAIKTKAGDYNWIYIETAGRFGWIAERPGVTFTPAGSNAKTPAPAAGGTPRSHTLVMYVTATEPELANLRLLAQGVASALANPAALSPAVLNLAGALNGIFIRHEVLQGQVLPDAPFGPGRILRPLIIHLQFSATDAALQTARTQGAGILPAWYAYTGAVSTRKPQAEIQQKGTALTSLVSAIAALASGVQASVR